jgi:hypothetical protein
MPVFKKKAVKKVRARGLSREEKDELKELLTLETGRDDAGIIELAKKGALMSDLHLNKLARVKTLVERL